MSKKGEGRGVSGSKLIRDGEEVKDLLGLEGEEP